MNQSENANPKPHLSALDKIDKILLKCDELQKETGQSNLWFGLTEKQVDRSPNDVIRKGSSHIKISYLISSNELGFPSTERDYLLNLLKELNFVKVEVSSKGPDFQYEFKRSNQEVEILNGIWQLRIEGFKRIAELRKSVYSNKAFIAMSFKDSLDETAQTIIQAVQSCSYEACHLKFPPYGLHNENIANKIISEIKTSKFVIADFTLNSPNVYWEAGFAKGLGREVIHCVREEDVEKIAFDIEQILFIRWKDHDELSNKLIDTIRATID